jgi:hypothetical protein
MNIGVLWISVVETPEAKARELSVIYRVIYKSLGDLQPLRYSSRDGHAEGEHVNRGRETASFCPTLQVLDMAFLLCLSWFRRDL